MRITFNLAQKMGAALGGSEVLQRKVPQGEEPACSRSDSR